MDEAIRKAAGIFMTTDMTILTNTNTNTNTNTTMIMTMTMHTKIQVLIRMVGREFSVFNFRVKLTVVFSLFGADR